MCILLQCKGQRQARSGDEPKEQAVEHRVANVVAQAGSARQGQRSHQQPRAAAVWQLRSRRAAALDRRSRHQHPPPRPRTRRAKQGAIVAAPRALGDPRGAISAAYQLP
jgi:hypothetical protein